MNGNSSGTPVGIFSMMPGLSQEGEHVLSTMLSNNLTDKKEEYPVQFNNLVIESFLKQHNLANSPTTASSSISQAPTDGIVPEISTGLNKIQTFQAAVPPPIPVVQTLPNVSYNNRKRKNDENPSTFTNIEPPSITMGGTVDGGPPRDLSAEEKLVMKKQRRLVKNREAAQLFRQRQKEYIHNLELKAAELTSANTEANARVELLASENKLMKEQLVYLRNFMKQAVSYSFPYSAMPTTTATSATGGTSQVPTTPTTAPTSPQLSPTMAPALGNSFLDLEAYPDIRISGLSGTPVGTTTRQAVITTADGTSLNVNMGVVGSGLPIPAGGFPVSLIPMGPIMPGLSPAATVPSVSPGVPSTVSSPQLIHQQQAGGGLVGLVPNRDEKETLMPD